MRVGVGWGQLGGEGTVPYFKNGKSIAGVNNGMGIVNRARHELTSSGTGTGIGNGVQPMARTKSSPSDAHRGLQDIKKPNASWV